MNKPVKWYFNTSGVIRRNDDGTFQIEVYCDEITEAVDADDNPVDDPCDVGGVLITAYCRESTQRDSQHLGLLTLATGYLPENWEEPLTPDERAAKELREMLLAFDSSE